MTRELDPAVLDEIVRRIVEVAQPERIILFGSAARGEMGPDSDLDLLVVKAGEYPKGRLTGEIYLRLYGVGTDRVAQAHCKPAPERFARVSRRTERPGESAAAIESILRNTQ